MRSTRRRGPGVAPLTEKREEFARLIAAGVNNAEACRIVGVHRKTGTRWRLGRTFRSSAGVERHYPPVMKAGLLALVEHAVGQGWSRRRACRLLEVDEDRVGRWGALRGVALRSAGGGSGGDHGEGGVEAAVLAALADAAPGGGAVHGLLPEEQAAILDLYDAWGEIDRSHRKLAHRGSRLDLVYVSESTVRCVLAGHGLFLEGPPPRPPRERAPWPDWLEWKPQRVSGATTSPTSPGPVGPRSRSSTSCPASGSRPWSRPRSPPPRLRSASSTPCAPRGSWS